MRRKLLIIFLLACGIRLLFLAAVYVELDPQAGSVFPQYDGYYTIAENLLHGHGFTRSSTLPFIPDSVRMPLYPLVIAGVMALFGSHTVVMFLQLLLGSLIPLFGYRIALQLLQREGIATAVAVFLAFEPFTVSLATTSQSETLFTVLFLAGINVFLDYFREQRVQSLGCATLLLGLATLTRPTIQFIPLLMLPVMFFLLRKNMQAVFTHSLLMLLIFFGTLAPWSMRNFLRFGNPALSVQYASVPYGYLIPSVLALEKGIGFQKAQREFYEGEGGIKDVEEITLANATFYKKRATEILKEHPVSLIKSIGVTFLTFFTHDGYLDVLYRLGLEPSIRLEKPSFILFMESPKKVWDFVQPLLASPTLFVILGRVAWFLITLSCIAGTIRYLRAPENRIKGIFIVLVILYFALTTIAVGLAVNARFRFPVNALILTFAAYGVSSMLQKRTSFASSIIPTKLVPAKAENRNPENELP